MFGEPSLGAAVEFAFLSGYEDPEICMKASDKVTLGGGGGQMQSTIDAAAEKAENVGESWKHDVTTPPLTAYIRPASLVTF